MSSYTICNNVVSQTQLDAYQTNIDKIIAGVTASDGMIDINIIIEEAIKQLKSTDKSMADARKIVNDCINNYKQKMNQPETNYDDKNTTYIMLENSLLVHQEIIYRRIQMIVYICGLIYFFYLYKVK
jgi:uncharacterized membrane-anchored protein